MKKVLAIVLALTMILSTSCLVMATEEQITIPATLQLKAANGSSYSSSASVYAGKTVDLKATVDMSNVREAFTAGVEKVDAKLAELTTVEGDVDPSAADLATAKAEFRNSKASGQVDLVLTYPSAIIMPTSVANGSDLDGFVDVDTSIWEEVSRKVTTTGSVKTLTITIGVKEDSVDVADIEANLDTYLADMSFVASGLYANQAASYSFTGSLEGEVSFNLQIGDGLLPYEWTFVDDGDSSAKLTILAMGTGSTTGGGVYIPSSSGSSDTVDDSTQTDTQTGTQTGTSVTENFIDMHDYDWAKDAVYNLQDKHIITGTSAVTFDPALSVKRGDIVLMLSRMLNLDNSFDTNFADVPYGSYYYEAIGKAKAAGVAQGYSDTEFKPEQTVTREELVTLIYRALRVYGYIEAGEDTTALNAYVDGHQVSDYAVEAMVSMVNNGVIQGKGSNNIAPQDEAIRAEVAVMLNRLLPFVK